MLAVALTSGFELMLSIAVRLAFPSNDRCHGLGSRLKHLVADAMSVRVVEVLEMIDVDHDEAKRFAAHLFDKLARVSVFRDQETEIGNSKIHT